MRPRVKVRGRLGLQVLFDFTDIIDAIEFAAGHGFSVLELNLGNIGFARQLARKQERARIRAAARSRRVKLAVHAMEGFSFFTPNLKAVRCGVSELKRVLDRAQDAGIVNVVMHLGFEMHYGIDGKSMFSHEAFPDFHEQVLFDSLAELKDYTRGRPRLCVENVGGFRFDFSHRVMDRLLGGNLGLCLDVGHLFVLSPSKRKQELEFFRRHRRQVFHCHLHDNNGTRDEHLALGKGKIAFPPVLRLLAGTGALLVFEVRPKEAALRSLEYFEDRIAPRL